MTTITNCINCGVKVTILGMDLRPDDWVMTNWQGWIQVEHYQCADKNVSRAHPPMRIRGG